MENSQKNAWKKGKHIHYYKSVTNSNPLGLKIVPSGRPGQVSFPAGQVTFYSHLPIGQLS